MIGGGGGETGVVHGALLLAFADAAVGDDDAALARAGETVRETLGEAAFVDAAATAASFNSVVRVADATGIPIEAYKEEPVREILNDLGIEDLTTGLTA